MATPEASLSQLFLDGFSIVLSDLLLAGDNALVIAMAVRALPERQRKIATLSGAGAAVALRIALTVVAAQLLNLQFLKLIGGLLVIWIAIKVLADADAPPSEIPARGKLIEAIRLIVFADITMSIDNVLAVAGAARGNIPMIVFGLAVSIPLVVFSSNLIAKMMNRFPAILYLGGAVLGRVGGEMIMSDPFIVKTFQPGEVITWAVDIIAVIAILVIGKLLCRKHPHPVTKPSR